MRIFKKISNLLLAVILLIATTGVTLNKHYCLGRLKSVAINEIASPCAGEKGEPIQMPCCEDVTQELKVEEITQVLFDFDGQPDLFELAFIRFFVLDEPILISEKASIPKHYSPPPPEIDVQVDLQVFLI